MTSRKIEKLSHLIQEKISRIVLYELNDPRLGFLTITKIKLSKDLKSCIVFYSQIGTEADHVKTAHALESARGYVQRAVAQSLRTRQTPILQFKYDHSIEGSIRVSQIIDRITREREQREKETGGEEEPPLPGEEKSHEG